MTTKRKKVGEERVGAIKTDYPKSDSYRATYSCGNCGWHGSISFKKGKFAPATTTCPTCECSGANKSLPYVRRGAETVPLPLPKEDPIIPLPELPKPNPYPYPFPYDPWVVPHRPWDVPPRPYLDPRRTSIIGPDTQNDHDNTQRYRADRITIDEYDQGLGFSHDR